VRRGVVLRWPWGGVYTRACHPEERDGVHDDVGAAGAKAHPTELVSV
jgi:hypothetical protein